MNLNLFDFILKLKINFFNLILSSNLKNILFVLNKIFIKNVKSN